MQHERVSTGGTGVVMEIDRRWFGVLTNENIEGVVAVVREIVKGRFCIAEAEYCDSSNANLRLISPDCATDSRWTSTPEKEQVRLFTEDDGRKWFGFSAGGYFWSFNARADGRPDHEDYRYPYFVFEYDKFTVTQRAPAGKGYLHKRAFGAHRTENRSASTVEGSR